jgi:hypothetical protein
MALLSYEVQIQKDTSISPQKQVYIDYMALGGAVMDDEGKFNPVAADEIAKICGVKRNQLYRWRGMIPNFWELVEHETG